MTAIINDNNFDSEVLASGKPVIVCFSATWSPESRNLAPNLAALAAERSDLKIAKIDVGGMPGPDGTLVDIENPVSRERFNIRTFPVLVLFKGGEVVHMALGELGKEQIEKWADSMLNRPNMTTLPVEKFPAYIEQTYELIQKEFDKQAQERMELAKAAAAYAIKIQRRIEMAVCFAKAAGGFALGAAVPGIGTVLGAIIMGGNGLKLWNTFRNKQDLPQELNLNKPLRFLFNTASVVGGIALIFSGAVALQHLSLSSVLDAGKALLGFAISWPAFKALTGGARPPQTPVPPADNQYSPAP